MRSPTLHREKVSRSKVIQSVPNKDSDVPGCNISSCRAERRILVGLYRSVWIQSVDLFVIVHIEHFPKKDTYFPEKLISTYYAPASPDSDSVPPSVKYKYSYDGQYNNYW